MKRNKVVAAIATGIAAAAMAVNPQPTQAKQANEVSVVNQKATREERKTEHKVTRHNVGGSGLDVVTELLGQMTMTPKEYGIRFGHGNRKGKANRLRLAHNKKVKNRISSSHK